MSGFKQVEEFHVVFGHPTEKEYKFNILTDFPDLIKFRISLIDEEIHEFIEACDNHDFIEAIDAICDTMYVVYGTFHTIGVNYDKYETLAKSLYNNDKSKFNIFTEYNDLLDKEKESLLTYLKDLNNYAIDNKSYSDFVNTLDLIICQCYKLGSLFGVDIDACFSEVHRCNMTKVCKTEEEAKVSMNWYIENEKRYKDPSYKKSIDDKYWIIYDRETSKTLKSINVEKPNDGLKKIVGME